MELYHAVFCFFVYAFIGWCTEVAFAAVREKTFVNRGFLNGPLCPIYGVGVVAVVWLLEPYKSRLIPLYVLSMLVVTALEWVTGFILEKLFHNKWWDYSDMPLNLNGYVCLLFSLVWGVGCVVIVKWVHPFIFRGICAIPRGIGTALLILFGAGFCADLYVTVNRILKLNKRLEIMQEAAMEIAEELHKLSDNIGGNIYRDVVEVMEFREEVSEDIREKTEHLRELREKYHSMMQANMEAGRHFLRAFPKMQSDRYKEALQDLKDYLKKN